MFREFVAHKRVTERERDRQLSASYNAAALSAQAAAGKLPSFESVLRQTKPFAGQGVQKQRETLAQLAGAYGLKLGKTRLVRKAS